MATWVSHLIIADKVLEKLPHLLRHEFCVGNIAPDCNIENDDFTDFTPSREVTHWMQGSVKMLDDSERFLDEFVRRKNELSAAEESFLLGYYAHLITDAEFRIFICDEERLRASWRRIKAAPALKEKTRNMPETWENVKALFPKKERMKDIYSIEKKYLDIHKESGYITEILPLKVFPDYIDYLPQGAIVRKINVMGYMPQEEQRKFPYIVISEEEYYLFLEKAAERVADGIRRYCTAAGRA